MPGPASRQAALSDARLRYAARVGVKHPACKAVSATGVGPRWLLLTALVAHAVLARGACDAGSRAEFAAALQRQCPDNGDENDGKRTTDCSSLRLRNVCIVQDTFVLYDPEAADQHPNGVPAVSFDVSSLQYWYRHMSPLKTEQAMHQHDAAMTLHSDGRFSHGSTVLGHAVRLPRVHIRYAAEHEIFVGSDGPLFSCEQPVVMYSRWSMNFAEYFSTVALQLHQLVQQNVTADRLVQFVPEKLPLETFNRWILAAFSKQPPTSLAEFSAMGSPRGNCFEELLLLKVSNAGYPLMPKAAATIAQYYSPQVPASPWRTAGNDSVRIVFETRPNKSMRQLGNLDAVLAECNAVPTYECVAYTFHEVHADMAIMKRADVLVTYHGAGETNVLWMEHPAILEVHAKHFGTRHSWWYSFWWPMISMQTDCIVKTWGLNFEDDALNTPSALEAEGIETNEVLNARDRGVKLQWAPVQSMLQKMVPMLRNATAFCELSRTKMAGTQYTWANGTLTMAPPVFCDERCNGKPASQDCRPCKDKV